MNINLITESVVLILSIFLTSILTFLLTHLSKKTPTKKILYTLLAATITSLLLEFILHLFYPSDKLPWTLWLMFFPFVLTLFLPALYWRSDKKRRKFRWISLAAILPGLLFSLVLINNYYRFYPTLYSVLGIETREQALSDQNATFLQFGSTAHEKYDATSIEASLYSQATGNTKGTIQAISIPGQKSHFRARQGFVYVPEIANSPAKLNLPVIILLPGTPGFPQNTLDGFAVESTMNELANLHKGITPYVFMLDDTGSLTNDTECVDSVRGNVETYLAIDVPEFIKTHFEVATDPSGWAIGGLSMGGMCSAMLALRHPNIYHYFLDFGGEGGPEVGPNTRTISTLFSGSQKDWANHQIPNLLENHKYSNMGGYFVSARDDSRSLVNSIHNNYLQAKAAGLETIYESINGEHTFNIWAQGFKDAIPWLSNRLGATICSTSCK